MYEPKFYLCKKCGNLITMIKSSGVPVVCCGEEMTLLVPNTTDAAKEKHVPEIKIDGNKLTATIGSVIHPMTAEHQIMWIYLLTDKGCHVRMLASGEEPSAVFTLNGEKPVSVYEYCNLHGLWKKDL